MGKIIKKGSYFKGNYFLQVGLGENNFLEIKPYLEDKRLFEYLSSLTVQVALLEVQERVIELLPDIYKKVELDIKYISNNQVKEIISLCESGCFLQNEYGTFTINNRHPSKMEYQTTFCFTSIENEYHRFYDLTDNKLSENLKNVFKFLIENYNNIFERKIVLQ